MLFRSTGLGKTELLSDITGVYSQGDYLIMEMVTTEPVRWKIRGGISHRDLRVLLKTLLRFSVLRFLLAPHRWFREPEHPGEY
jgi:hypothetical protein